MIKITLLGSTLAIALSAAPAMAADFHALAGLQGTNSAPLQDEVLAATEGGVSCISAGGSAADSQSAGGVCLAADLVTIHHAVADPMPVTSVQFLQVFP